MNYSTSIRSFRLLARLVFGIAFVGVGLSAHAVEDAQCFTCHNDPNLSTTGPDGQNISLYLDQGVYEHSVHNGIGCVACHADITDLPHNPGLKPVDCSSCHDETSAYAESVHGKRRKEGDKDVATCVDCHGTHDMRASTDPLSRTNKRNVPQTCGKCHSDPALVAKHMISISMPSDSYLKGVHAKAIRAGNYKAAVCTDCHGGHDILAASDPKSTVNRANIPKTCGKCHADVMAEYDKSIHGKALAHGIPDAPTCIDCHGEHDIEAPETEGSSTSAQQISRSTCPRCHDDIRKMTRYNIPTMRQASYMDSYHGMASAAGSKVVANCSSCHGVHNILPAADPMSTINPANLPGTCGKCHENAGPNFAKGPVHLIPTEQWALGIVQTIYLWAIALILGSMILHNSLLLLRDIVLKYRREKWGPNTVPRFTPGQTFGHLILSICFIVLVVTGFALRYPENPILKLFFINDAGFALRSQVHRIAAVGLILVTLLHVVHSIVSKKGRREMLELMLRPRDIVDAIRNLGFAVGLARKAPKFARYGYSEKMEYWGMMWGSVVMIVTGLCMWFASDFMRHFPKVALDVLSLIHYYEAWLALGTIVVWHFYYMIFSPEAYPMNMSWLTGRITVEDFKERHGLEYERLVAEGVLKPIRESMESRTTDTTVIRPKGGLSETDDSDSQK